MLKELEDEMKRLYGEFNNCTCDGPGSDLCPRCIEIVTRLHELHAIEEEVGANSTALSV